MTQEPKTHMPKRTRLNPQDKAPYPPGPSRRQWKLLLVIGCVASVLFAASAFILAQRDLRDAQVASAPPDIGGPFPLVGGGRGPVTPRRLPGKYPVLHLGLTLRPHPFPH